MKKSLEKKRREMSKVALDDPAQGGVRSGPPHCLWNIPVIRR